jgi:MFS family permease
MTNQAVQPADNRYGWVMVAVGFGLQTLAFGGIGSVGVFLKPLAAEFDWSRAEVSAGYTSVALSAAAFGILWGWLSDRKGGRNIALFGVVMMGISYFALSMTGSLWYYFLLHFAFGALGNSAVSTPLFAAVGFWFTRNQGLAIGLMAAGGAFGQAVFPVMARWIIDAYDWQTAYGAIGITFLVIGVPLALLVKDPPSRRVAGGAAAAVQSDEPPLLVPVRTVLFFLSSAAFFCCICMSVPIVHVVALVSDRGVDPSVAAWVLSALMIAGISGRILGGKLADMVGAIPAWMIASLGQTLLVLLFPFVDVLWMTFILAAVFGLFYSADMSTILVAGRMLLPARIAAQALGVVVFFGWLGMGTGAWLGGELFDQTGGYFWSYAAAAAGGVVNLMILAVFMLKLRGRKIALPKWHEDPGGLASPGLVRP